MDGKGKIGHADYFSALGIDDLLIKQVARKAQHVLVGMVRSENLFLQVDAAEGDGSDLIVPDGQPSGISADQEAVDSDRMDQRNQCGILDHTDPASPEIVHPEADKFGEKQHVVRHRKAQPI